MRIYIATHYTERVIEGIVWREPQYVLDFGQHFEDASGTPEVPADPNVVVVASNIPDNFLPTILAHPDYGLGALLFDEPNPYPGDGLPDAAEYGQRRAHFAKLGVSNAQFRAMFGEPGNPHTRKVGADNCIQWTKGLSRGR